MKIILSFLIPLMGTSMRESCPKENVQCLNGNCSCLIHNITVASLQSDLVGRRLDDDSGGQRAGAPVVETRTITGCGPCVPAFSHLWLLVTPLIGFLLACCVCLVCPCIPRREKRVTRSASINNYTDRKSLHAEFTQEQFLELARSIDIRTLIVNRDVECFTRQGPTQEIMYGTISKGWQLWQLHSSMDDDDQDQDPDTVREILMATDGIAFPITGYFFVDSIEFEEAARRAQDLENGTAPLLQDNENHQYDPPGYQTGYQSQY